MTDAQIIAIAITVLAVLGGTLVNNSRLTDVKEVLRAELHKETVQLRLEFTERFLAMERRFDSVDRKLDELLRLVADHETRLRAVEDRPH